MRIPLNLFGLFLMYAAADVGRSRCRPQTTVSTRPLCCYKLTVPSVSEQKLLGDFESPSFVKQIVLTGCNYT